MLFGDAQTGQLDRANGRTSDVIAISDECAAQNKATDAKLNPKPWWHFGLF